MNNITELLNEQLDLLTKVLGLTVADDLSEVMDEEKSDKYSELYIKREPLMFRVQEIQQELSAGGESALPIDTLQNEDKAVAAKIQETVNKIIKLDEAYKQAVTAYMESLRGEIKGLKKGRAANEAYINEIYSDGGEVMNKKN